MNNNHIRLAFWTASSFIVISIGVLIYTFFAEGDIKEMKDKEYARFVRSNLFQMRILSMIMLLWSLMSVIVLRYKSRKGLLIFNTLLTVVMYIVSIGILVKQTHTLITHRDNKQIARDSGLYLGFSLIANLLALGYFVYFIYPGMRHMNI